MLIDSLRLKLVDMFGRESADESLFPQGIKIVNTHILGEGYRAFKEQVGIEFMNAGHEQPAGQVDALFDFLFTVFRLAKSGLRLRFRVLISRMQGVAVAPESVSPGSSVGTQPRNARSYFVSFQNSFLGVGRLRTE